MPTMPEEKLCLPPPPDPENRPDVERTPADRVSIFPKGSEPPQSFREFLQMVYPELKRQSMFGIDSLLRPRPPVEGTITFTPERSGAPTPEEPYAVRFCYRPRPFLSPATEAAVASSMVSMTDMMQRAVGELAKEQMKKLEASLAGFGEVIVNVTKVVDTFVDVSKVIHELHARLRSERRRERRRWKRLHRKKMLRKQGRWPVH
jgi:hypothetical protein